MRRNTTLPVLSLCVALMAWALASAATVYAGEGWAPSVAIGPQGDRYPDGTAVASVTNSPALEARIKEKTALRDLYLAMLQGSVSSGTYQTAQQRFYSKYNIPSRSTPMTAMCLHPPCLQSNYVSLTQNTEQYCPWLNPPKYCYCGPSTGVSMLNQLGYPTSHDRESLSQNNLAINKYMETNYWGNTPWTGLGNDHPVPESLNYWMTGSYSGFYIPDGLPNARPDLTHFKQDVVADIDAGYSLAPDIHEKAYDGNHLPGHPDAEEIWHWFPIYGYSSYANTIAYADPATIPPWPGVQPYASVTASQIDTLLQDRGLVW